MVLREEVNTILYDNVKKLCDQKNITISKLENILSFGNGTIHKWGYVQPSIDKVKKVAVYFGIGLDTIYSDDEVPTQESLEIAREYFLLTPNQKDLVKCYISLIKNSQESKKGD